jgi:hypothetical protein
VYEKKKPNGREVDEQHLTLGVVNCGDLVTENIDHGITNSGE